MSATPQQNESAHVARYEELRRNVVEQQVLAGRLGLAVLLQQGLAAWVEQWAKIPRPTPTLSTELSRSSPLSDDTNAAVIHVLATMALGHMQEVRA